MLPEQFESRNSGACYQHAKARPCQQRLRRQEVVLDVVHHEDVCRRGCGRTGVKGSRDCLRCWGVDLHTASSAIGMPAKVQPRKMLPDDAGECGWLCCLTAANARNVHPSAYIAMCVDISCTTASCGCDASARRAMTRPIDPCRHAPRLMAASCSRMMRSASSGGRSMPPISGRTSMQQGWPGNGAGKRRAQASASSCERTSISV